MAGVINTAGVVNTAGVTTNNTETSDNLPIGWSITREDLPTVFKHANRHLNEFAYIIHPWHIRSISNHNGLIIMQIYQKSNLGPRDIPKYYTAIWVLMDHPDIATGRFDQFVEIIRGMTSTPHMSLMEVVNRAGEVIKFAPNHVVDYFSAYHQHSRELERIPDNHLPRPIGSPMTSIQIRQNARQQQSILSQSSGEVEFTSSRTELHRSS